jgi:ubiquinone/menaquinone biosynthesis C-methylase UbiE
MTTNPRTYYDRFSTSYDQRRGHGYHALIDELEVSAVDGQPGIRLLEAGCGTGLMLERLRPTGAQLFGADLSGGMLKHARERGHRVAQASINELPFANDSFDVVCSFKVLAHVPDIRGAAREMARIVKPGGRLVLEFYNRNSLRGLRWSVKRMFGGERTGDQQREAHLFTRYDSVAEMTSYLPPNTRLEAVRGAIVFTPAAVAFRVPGLSQVLTLVERRAAMSALARRAGFVILIARKL